MPGLLENMDLHLKEDGFPFRVVSIDHLPELQDELTNRKAGNLFDDTFYKERLTFFSFQIPNTLPGAKSLMVVAMPSAQTPLIFNWKGKRYDLILPPTYRGYNQNVKRMGDHLSALLASDGFHVVPARLPQKLLAVRSGLAEYGRNNVTYIPGLGSFYQPTVFFSDLPVMDDPWSEARMMARCQGCRACLLKCPTGAIAEDRFLLHAERCLVFHNEREASTPFPQWIDPAVHNSLMGCMLCQQYCPEDKPFMDWFEGGEEFSEEETALLLNAVGKEQLPESTIQKLERLELLEDLEKLPRNLKVLLR